MDNPPLSKSKVYCIQILFVISISIGSQNINIENAQEWLGTVARYIVYLYLIRGSRVAIALSHQTWQSVSSVDLRRLWGDNSRHCVIFAASVATVLYKNQILLKEDFPLLFISYLVSRYPDMERQGKTVTYGTGMACSYFEGYLMHVIPSDGHKFNGFEENIIAYEGDQSIRFPVRRLFLVITKTMFCPPDLKQLDDRIEACKSLEDVVKNVAGVMKRSYKNTAYKINRPGARPVYLAVECATPIHTLYRVLQNRTLYQELDGISEAEVVSDFMWMLSSILAKSPECRNKCELVYFDNTGTERLSDILLERIRQIEPNFEEIIQMEADQ